MSSLQQDLRTLLSSNITNPPAYPTALVWLDGFVDEIFDVVDKRFTPDRFTRIKTIADFAQRIKSISGQSGNLELVSKQVKYGGNAPILVNALSQLQIPTILIGCLGDPKQELSPPFSELQSSVTKLISIAPPSYTDALEFDDGKLMLGKHASLHQISWNTIRQNIGEEQFLAYLIQSPLFAQVNWVMIPQMNDIWDYLLKNILPSTSNIIPTKYSMYFDLCDPEKRIKEDIRSALRHISQFQQYYQVILGLNLREAQQIANVQGLAISENISPKLLASKIRTQLGISEVIIHNAQFAVSAYKPSTSEQVYGITVPYVKNPVLLTGAGDHFNAGYCYGILNSFPPLLRLMLGISTATSYVQNGTSPTIEGIQRFNDAWIPRILSDH